VSAGAGYKVPKRLVAVDELPRTGTTTVQRGALLGLFRWATIRPHRWARLTRR
jgi:acyl-CoA synthetase (AMP-forming)/AMP-acid ligase II